MSIEEVVWDVIYLLGAGLVFALLMGLVKYLEREFPDGQPWFKYIRIFIVVAAFIIAIFFVLALMGHPVIHFRKAAMLPWCHGLAA